MHISRSPVHCRRVIRRWQERFLSLTLGLALAVLIALGAGITPAAADTQVLRVLKLKQHELNHPHRHTAGESRMLAGFARRQGLDPQWLDAYRPDELYARLGRGEGDMVVADLGPTSTLDPALVASLSMGTFRYYVYGRRELDIVNPRALGGFRVAISVSSPLWPYFDQLRHSIPALDVVVLPANTSREALLGGIASGSYDAAVAAARPSEKPLDGLPRLKVLFELSDPNAIAWYFPRHRHDLRDDINSYMQRFHASILAPQRAMGDLDTIRQRRTLRVITRIDPQNYFVQDGRPVGFEYELVQMFAREHQLDVEFLVGETDQQILQWLRAGAGDLVTTRIDAGQVRVDPALKQSRSYFHSASVVIGRTGGGVDSAQDLAGKRVAVLGSTVQHRALSELVASGVAVEPVVISPDTPLDDVAEQIENWRIDAAIVDAHAIAGLRAVHPLIQAGVSLPTELGYAWTVRANDTQLGEAVNAFVQQQFGTDTCDVLAQRYLEHSRYAYFSASERLSPYDQLVRRYADTYDFDWRLIVAQMYQESEFDPHAVSPGGARGLMQLTPATARAMGVSNPFDPAAGIRGGVRYLRKLHDRFDTSIPPRERTWFALAAYNVGYYRVDLARQRAQAAGLDPTRWFGHVETIMLDMGAAKAGGRSHQTVEYVRAIRSLYNTYDRQQEALTASVEHTRGAHAG